MNKDEWKKVKLGEVCEISFGTRVVQKRDGGSIFPVYGGGGITFKMDIYNRENAIIVSRFAMSPQCTRFVEGKFFLNDSGLSVEPKNSDLLFDFLKYCIFANNDRIYSLGRGAAQKNLQTDRFQEIEIPLPPLATQTKISAELDRLNEIISKKKQQLAELDTLAAATFHEMFGDPIENEKGWEVKKLGEICEFITDGTHQTPTYTDDKENGYKFLSAKDVVSGVIDWSNIKYIPKELHEELYKRLAPKRNDILLCKNGTTGICALVDTDEVFDIYVSLALLRPKNILLPKYLVSAINNPATKQQFDDSLKGVGVPNLHLAEIRKTLVILPPLPLQQTFAARIEEIERLKEKIKSSLAATQQLLAATMDKYFG